ncbi:MAG: hypothetical protein JJ902_10745 [Roseibium sp.]|nr:hypothetical protein [Roseibium sp.]
MIETLADDIKRWTAKRKSALVIEIIRGKTMLAKDGTWSGRSMRGFSPMV